MNARSISRFRVLIIAAAIACIAVPAAAQPPGRRGKTEGVNLAVVARASTSYVSGHETLAALNDSHDPRDSDDKRQGAYGNWPRSGTQWVQYEWDQPISTRGIDVYWFDDGRGVRLPKACRLSYWDGERFVPVPEVNGPGLERNCYNSATFAELRTTRLRLELDSDGTFSTGILEWRVLDSGNSPNFPPAVSAGVDRVVVLPGQTWLQGSVQDDGKPNEAAAVVWSKLSGPGEVRFEDAHAAVTTATFSATGQYVLRLSADDGQSSAADTLQVLVDPPPPAEHLWPVTMKPYRIDNPLWSDRLKQLIVSWIPHCYRQISDPDLREGGIENFTQAGNKLAGRPHSGHRGAVFANAWVHNTVEAMCVALMLDPQGDQELVRAQQEIRATLDDWIPKLLSAQEPDGYLQTFYTLNGTPRWTNKHDHEGYLAGYFMEAAVAHYQLTGGTDTRLYDAARRLADCWCANIGPPPKRAWYEGHQELEQALVRLARLVEQVDGPGSGHKYVQLAKFLTDSRRDGEEYDQSHLPVVQQYEAVGHAVRAAYSYAGMADIALETGDVDYHSAIRSLWDNIVNKKYYVTGGIGSGETAEGFGQNYSLPHNAYCESCAGCGQLFFQHKLHLIHQQSAYADLYEETIYNAILGSIDLDGKNFYYTNSLDSSAPRHPWHVCPCCVGNIPRTLLMLPTWMYSKTADSVFVNLFVGSTVSVGEVAGTEVQLVQATDYPWSGRVAITVNPAAERQFAVKIRLPDRSVSQLYESTPAADGLESIALNGQPVTPPVENGYAVLARTWRAGDRIELLLPMRIQRVKSSDKVPANAGRVALRYGPLIYNIESVDQDLNGVLPATAPLTTRWQPDLLRGVLTIHGDFADGSQLTAVPNYARLNRGGRSLVWIRDGEAK